MDIGYSNSSRAETAGVVEIGKIPKMFYTPAYGAPDVLFCSLLSSAREAYQVTATGGCTGDPRHAGHFAETYMAGVLLRDENFVPARVLRNYAHHYQLDFIAGIFRLRTELFAVQARSTSLFGVKLEGLILGQEFIVRDAVTQKILVKATEEQIQRPDFFSRELPLVACEAQRAPGGAPEASAMVDDALDLLLTVSSTPEARRVVKVAKDKGDLQAIVSDPETGEVLCKMTLESLKDIRTMMGALQRLLPGAPANTSSVVVPR